MSDDIFEITVDGVEFTLRIGDETHPFTLVVTDTEPRPPPHHGCVARMTREQVIALARRLLRAVEAT